MAEPTFDHERLDVYRLSIDYVAFSYRIANRDVLSVCDAIDEESNLRGKAGLKRVEYE